MLVGMGNQLSAGCTTPGEGMHVQCVLCSLVSVVGLEYARCFVGVTGMCFSLCVHVCGHMWVGRCGCVDANGCGCRCACMGGWVWVKALLHL